MITGATTALLLERSGGICECCGHRPGSNRHHRRSRGMGGDKRPGTDSISNLLLVCGTGAMGCHGWLETHREESYASGLLVLRSVSDEDIASVPVRLACGVVTLTGTGTYEKVPT